MCHSYPFVDGFNARRIYSSPQPGTFSGKLGIDFARVATGLNEDRIGKAY
jgi:hypothetical protein